MVVNTDLLSLAETWEHIARTRFEASVIKENVPSKRQIERSAMIYFNCAQELRAILNVPLLPILTTRKANSG